MAYTNSLLERVAVQEAASEKVCKFQRLFRLKESKCVQAGG